MVLACHLLGFGFEAPGAADVASNMAAIVNHMATVHPDWLPNGARDSRVKPPPLIHPTIDLGPGNRGEMIDAKIIQSLVIQALIIQATPLTKRWYQSLM